MERDNKNLHVQHVFMRRKWLRSNGCRVKIRRLKDVTIYQVFTFNRLCFEIYDRHQFDACVFVLTREKQIACKNVLISLGIEDEDIVAYCELGNEKIIKLVEEE